MRRKGRVYRKAKMSAFKTMIAVALCSIVIFPIITVNGAENTEEDNGEISYSLVEYNSKWNQSSTEENKVIYEVSVNGTVIGYTDDKDMAEDAYLNARLKISGEAEDMVYMNADVNIAEYDKAIADITDGAKLESQIYDVLKESIITPKKTAYILRVGDVTIYLENKDAVAELFEKIRDKYDADDEFEVVLEEDEGNMFSVLTANIVSPEREKNDLETVYASENGTYPFAEDDEQEYEIGVSSITFEENIEIIETYVPETQILSVDEAFEFLTKENEEKQMYTVVKGDCMWTIAKNHNMSTTQLFELNEKITEKSILQIGQQIVITVPEPELSVLVEEVVEYEEAYNAPVQYVYNDSWYTTKSVVLQEAEAGYHAVTANVYSRNGKEYDREILEEDVIEEPVAKIVEVGTIEPPTFIVPVNGAKVTSNYGYRKLAIYNYALKLHSGIDYGVATGTTVKASCSGTVIQAGWNGGYGYCVTIQHANGIKTKYAHLSKIYVKTGAKVTQGQKIALSGNSGNSTGPHLHFEIIVNGVAKDPRNYLNK